MDDALERELDRQTGRLVDLGYAESAGLSRGEFEDLVAPLHRLLDPAVDPAASATRSHVPFVLVVSRALVPAEVSMPLTTLAGRSKPGVVDRNHAPDGLAGYAPIKQVDIPNGQAYLLLDVERGEEFCGVRPEEALVTVLDRGRTPLTIDEGIAVVTLFPEVLEKNRCFMLSGSRRGDRRVPAMWISEGAPKLGWCWDGNPHTWLGTASAGGRVG